MARYSVLLLLFLCSCDSANSPDATPPLSEDSILVHLDFLADDSLYGRGSGTEYERQAAEYIRDAFVEYGLAPGVPGYLQTFVFEDGLSMMTSTALPVAADGAQNAQLSSQNVIAVLNGSGDLAGQWVVLGAHYDHIGFERVAEDSIVIYNGADDNASGTSLLLEVARYLEHYLTQGVARNLGHRSILFQAYGAEELGLVGSTYFVQHPTVPMDSITSMVNLDMVGRMRSETLIALNSSTSPRWVPLLSEHNEDDLNIVFPEGASGRSDHYPFYLANKPVIFLYTGTHDEYHQPDDDVWRINTDGMVKIGNLVVATLLDLVVRLDPPSFTN